MKCRRRYRFETRQEEKKKDFFKFIPCTFIFAMPTTTAKATKRSGIHFDETAVQHLMFSNANVKGSTFNVSCSVRIILMY